MNSTKANGAVVAVVVVVVVAPNERDAYPTNCIKTVRQARDAAGCLDFAISADVLVAGRINDYERSESQVDVEAFRGSGPMDEQGAAMRRSDPRTPLVRHADR